jgi:predicted AAA+ superfamily ATPase
MDAKTPAADDLTDTLRRIAEALERLGPRGEAAPDLGIADAFVWHPDGKRLVPVPKVNRVDMSLLRGIDRVRDVLMDNTERFAKGLPRTTRCSGARAAWANPRW